MLNVRNLRKRPEMAVHAYKIIPPKELASKAQSTKIGEGAFGVAYATRHNRGNVAFKKLKVEGLSDEECIKKMSQEATMLSLLPAHDHVNQLVGVVEVRGKWPGLGLVLLRIEGVDLHKMLEEKSIVEPAITKCLYGSICGYEHMHASGIIHR
jgi:serine/threonine protein kinase